MRRCIAVARILRGLLAPVILFAAGSVAAAPPSGPWLVIGSFATAGNASAWSGHNADFGTSVERVDASDGAVVYRVLVGPLEGDSLPFVQAILEKAGLASSWPVVRCAGVLIPGEACPAPAPGLASR